MHSRLRTLSLLTLALPFAALAEVPIIDSSTFQGGGYSQVGSGAVGASVVAGAQASASPQGMLFTQLEQMQQEIAALRGMLEEQQFEIQRLKQEALERYQDLDQRISANPAPVQNSAPAGAIDASGTPTPPVMQQQVPANTEPGDPAKEKLYYDAAFDLIKVKDFDKAALAFAAFLNRYPQSQYAGNAQYWLGEVNLAKGDMQAAGQAFAKVSQAYPTHSKVPDSLFKLADVERRLGNNDKARGILQQVIAQFPGSSAAQLAQRDLQRL